MGISLPRLSRVAMKIFVFACVAIAAVSADGEADAYTIAQVRAGIPAYKSAIDGQPRIITGISHGNGLVSGHLGLAGQYAGGYAYNAYPHSAYSAYSPYFAGHAIGKREADSEADAYTLGQVYHGLPYANAVATGHAHNPGYVAYPSHSAVPAYTGYTGYPSYTTGYTAGFNGLYHHAIGKREADSEADAYTPAQVYHGLPYA